MAALSRKRGANINMFGRSEKRLFPSTIAHAEEDPATLDAPEATLISLLAMLNPNQTGHNLLTDLPTEVLCKITACLDAPGLLRLRLVNRFYSRLAARNEAGWELLCAQLWKDKVHVAAEAVELRENRMEAYRLSLWDAAVRNYVRLQDLVYDPDTETGTIWSFRFKESAGTDWTSLDPWYQGSPVRQLVFLADGTVLERKPDGGLRTPHFQQPAQNQGVTDGDEDAPDAPALPPTPAPMSWRLITRPMDLPTRPAGSYVRVTVGGRDVPTYAVRRSPVDNWGFVMESCWGLFASFPLPARHGVTAVAEPPRSTPVMRRRLRRTPDGFVRWVWVTAEEAEATPQVDPWAPLRDDSHLLITNEVQWREAFLYNVGARVLPEGEEASDDFDRAWGGLGAR
jgi:hypothetical protein